MATDRQLQETLARCVSTVVFYHNSHRSQKSAERMSIEAEVIAGFVEELSLVDGEAERFIVRPLEVELIDRYGHELGLRLFGEFIRAFEGRGAIKSRHRETGGRERPLFLA